MSSPAALSRLGVKWGFQGQGKANLPWVCGGERIWVGVGMVGWFGVGTPGPGSAAALESISAGFLSDEGKSPTGLYP